MASTMRRKAAFSALWRAFVSSGGPSMGRRLGALPRMFWHTLTGRYDGAGRLMLVVLATAYIVSPVDLIPEMAFLLPGLVDDAFIITWLVGAVLSETERYLDWEDARKRHVVIDGDLA